MSRFLWFSRWRPSPCWIFKNSKFLRTIPYRGPVCVTVPNFIKIGQTVADIWRFNRFFQNGGRPPCWICWAPIGTTCDNHLTVSIVMQNLVEIYAEVSITWNFQYFARLAQKRQFTPPKLGFSGDFTPKIRSNVNETPKGTSANRNGSSGVLIMSLSVKVPEKSRGNKKCDKEEERTHFWPFLASL